MALFPITSADTSEDHSINGESFSIAYDVTPASAAETPFLLLTNPVSSTINLNILSVVTSAISRITSPTGVQTVVRIYGDPVITSNGTVQLINKQKLGSVIPTLMFAFNNPVVSSKGNLLDVWAVSSHGEATEDDVIDYSLIALPGHSFLVTVEGTVNGPSEIAVVIEWSEF
jgi:hypothetical protein